MNKELEMKEEFYKLSKYQEFVEANNELSTEMVTFIESLTNFWLSKRRKELEELREKVEGMKKKTIENMLQEDELFNERGMDGVKGYNKAISDVITLINLELK